MYITEETLDDILHSVLSKLLKSRNRINPSRGRATELSGVLLKIRNPRARLSRTEKKGKLFSCLGELLWYLARTKNLQFITYYLSRYKDESEDGRTVYGAYGPRLFKMDGFDQIGNVLSLLKENPDSRRAVIQLFDAADIAQKRREVPCTCTLQFMVRRHRLNMLTNMRSNDAFMGLPHDVFAFTMLQEVIARSLGVELGTYKHTVGSLHLYEKDIKSARQFLDEGFQETISMPPMPMTDPWSSIRKVLKAERAIRRSGTVDIGDLGLDNYWEDLVRLLQIYWHFRNKEGRKIARLRKRMSSPVYNNYIEQKRQTATALEARFSPEQLHLPYSDRVVEVDDEK